MANVFFKRGTLNSLNNQPIRDGTIYITTDERAMYVDIDGTQRIRLGDFVEYANWSAIEAIENPNPHSLYYANSENILAKYDAATGDWSQVNGRVAINRLISFVNQTAATANDITTVKTTLVDAEGDTVEGQTTYASANNSLLKITGSNTVENVTNRRTAAITITPANLKESASLSTSSISNGVRLSINNKQTGTDANGTAVNTSVADANPIDFIASNGLTITRDTTTGNINFSAEGAYTDLQTTFSNAGALSIRLSDGEGNSVTQSRQVTPTITYGKTDTTDAVFASGIAVLDVYTSSQVDTLIGNELKALDAMTFKGTLGTNGTVTDLPTTGVKNGDTYKVITASTFNNQECRIGDMFIAAGTENENGVLTAPIVWTYIPSGSDGSNDFFFTYDADNHSIKFNDNDGVSTAFNAGTRIAFSGTNNAITISHELVTRTNTTGTAQVQTGLNNLTFNAVTGITSDSTGHITEVVTTPITVVDTHNEITGVSVLKTADANANSISTQVTVTDEAGGHSATDIIQSSSLNLSVTNNATVIDLVWGTF